jgi:hypothetical protein
MSSFSPSLPLPPSLSLAWCSLLCFFFQAGVITLQPLPPLAPYVRLSRATPDKVLSILLSVVVGAGASTLPAPPLCAVFSVCLFVCF